MKNVCLSFLLVGAVAAATQPAAAELKMSAVFGDHMVLQQKQPIRVWGWTKPGQAVTVSFADQKKATTAGDDGRFDLKLDAVPAGGPYTMTVAADTSKTFNDVLVGEVWLCSGQSNMQWAVNSANDPDLESLTAKYPNLRLITVPQTGTQETQTTFNGQWQACTPETVRDFSAVGYFFGRQLHQTLDVPVGLIDNAWGGSACEAWVKRDLLSDEELYGPLLKRWEDIEASYDHEAATAQYKQRLAKWNETKKGNRPRPPRNQLAGQHRPANLYHGVLKEAGGRPVTMRTLDIGGDKALPYFPIEEDNPFLGWRGIRVTLDHPEIFLVYPAGIEKCRDLRPNPRLVVFGCFDT